MIDSTLGCCIPYPMRFTTAYYDGKVTYSGHNYQVLHYDFGACMVREENNKVYVIGNADSTERVLYDFTLKLNDTVFTNYEFDNYTSWVSSIDSTQLYGIWYKVWHFDGIDTNTYTNATFTYRYNVIEGLGCTNGVYYPAAPYDYAAYSDQLLCFTNNMGYTTGFSNPVLSYGYDYTNSFDNKTSCAAFQPPVTPPTDNTLGTKQTAGNIGNAVVIPNPVDESSKIVLPYTVRSGTLVIVNEIGRMTINMHFQDKTSISIADYIHNPGIYFYHVTDNQTGKVFSGKFSSR
ncbi:MAG: C-terminal target protein [Flavipsychrobacter sp.]|nr:C-terminal target protein [Flavipsychrobacter sp.]